MWCRARIYGLSNFYRAVNGYTWGGRWFNGFERYLKSDGFRGPHSSAGNGISFRSWFLPRIFFFHLPSFTLFFFWYEIYDERFHVMGNGRPIASAPECRRRRRKKKRKRSKAKRTEKKERDTFLRRPHLHTEWAGELTSETARSSTFRLRTNQKPSFHFQRRDPIIRCLRRRTEQWKLEKGTDKYRVGCGTLLPSFFFLPSCCLLLGQIIIRTWAWSARVGWPPIRRSWPIAGAACASTTPASGKSSPRPTPSTSR